ncbi:proline racemase [Scopulibacillus darangshiensis]|uniref:Proline racemase n=1 Tax=Scopulibacillus darangshiensis TaxID=442528 RepID=A0A4R2NP72_9BACL|nr:proline racemase family protein [Scopulibacillus darangshiensis]TCP23442.1 proline racemase [Scopulibacillus darangshiensis]
MQFEDQYTTIDAHTAGEPLRIITGGIPPVPGKKMLEKRAFFKKEWDHIRKVLMHEPRGHEGMYGCVVTPPVSDDADFGVLFMHNEGFSTMCGHGIIAVVTALVETGYFKSREEKVRFVIDSPAGKIIARAEHDGLEVASVSFENVPSFIYQSHVPLKLKGRTFEIDIAFGGAFYAIVQAKDLGVSVGIEKVAKLKDWGEVIKEQIEKELDVVHPLEKELKGIYGVIICDDAEKEDSDRKNVTIFADGQIDRSPCGTGTCAQMAELFHKGQLKQGELFVSESIVASQLTGRVLAKTTVGPFNAVLPELTGSAFITGYHQFVVDPADPLKEGFLLK